MNTARLNPPTKAIICAAGLGTRFLPQTKAMPKEMLPMLDRPVIQRIVEEAVAAGVTDIIMVTGASKRAIEDHFDRNEELERELRSAGKDAQADEIQRIGELANFVYIRQKGLPKGNARPVLNARHLLADEPFYVFFADDFFRSEIPRAVQLKNVYERTGKSVISLIEINRSDADKYGIATLGAQEAERSYLIEEVVEKPGEKEAKSNFASVGGYLLTPDILPFIDALTPAANGEITLADSINQLARADQVYGSFIEGVWHDTGDQLKYIEALIDIALEDDRFHEPLRAYLLDRLR